MKENIYQPNWVIWCLKGMIRFYQLSLSALIGRRCRYLPSCSDYMSEALEKHGLQKGLILGVARLSRCHPWGGEGIDPVPQTNEDSKASWFRKK